MVTLSESSGETSRDEPFDSHPATRSSSLTSAGETVTAGAPNKPVSNGDFEDTQSINQFDDHDVSNSLNEEPQGIARSSSAADGSVVEEYDPRGLSNPYDTRNGGNDEHASQAASYLQSIEQRLRFLESKFQQLDPTAPSNLYSSANLTSSMAPPPLPPSSFPPPPPPAAGVELPGAYANDLHYNTNHDRPFNLEDQIVNVSPEKWKETRSTRVIPASAALIVEKRELNPTSSTHQPAINGVEASDTDGQGSETAKTYSSQVPDKIAIGSCALIHDIGRISDLKMSHMPNVFIKPFKIFVSHEQDIRESAEKEELKYHRLVVEAKEKARLLNMSKSLNQEHTDHTETDVDGSSKADGEQLDLAAEEAEKARPEDDWEMTDDIKYSEALSNDYKCLIRLLDTELKPILDLRREIESSTLEYIAYDEIWHLFKPGDVVVSKNPKVRAYRVMHVTGGRPLLSPSWKPSGPPSLDSPFNDSLIRHGRIAPIILDCFYIDFDGRVFGPAPQVIQIQPFEGKRLVTSLDVYPVRFDKDQDSLMDMLTKRGARFVELSQVTHKRYTGLSLKDAHVFERTEELDSDVIIDFTLALRYFRQESERTYIGPQIDGGVVDVPTKADRRETFELLLCSVAGCNICTDNHDDSLFDLKLRSDFIGKTDLLHNIEIGKENLDQLLSDQDRLILLPARLYGYVLLSRKFYPLDVDIVEDINDADRGRGLDGFRDLVIDEDHKRIVKALVKTHTRGPRATISTEDSSVEVRAPESQLDLVRGKGRGLIILLHGVPGVGKTSTAECVAASTKRPLFPITCGDIGGDYARQVEDNLESYFELAHKWGCVLLLDEADVFLARRRRGDVKQNSLVSVFLRVLEYYSGILILTTNRVGEFDEAFKSRIHVSLYYKELDRASTWKIWRMNLDRLNRENKKPDPHRKIEFDTAEIMEFARGHWRDGHRWNGRQIKNAFQTAIALAEWDASDSPNACPGDIAHLETKHFKDVAIASARFDQYLLKVREERSEQMQAREMGIRRDDFDETGVPTATGITFPKYKATRRRRDEDFESADEYDDRRYDSDARNKERDERDSRKQRSNMDRNGRRKSSIADLYDDE